MTTLQQNDTLRKAIDGLPCRLSSRVYFDGAGDCCIIAHLSKYAGSSVLSETYLRKNNDTKVAMMPSIRKRLSLAFGFDEETMTTLQTAGDRQYDTKHARCVGLGSMLGRILKMRMPGGEQ